MGVLLLASALTGCLGARSRAERVELLKNPLRDAHPGEVCRYRALRDGPPGQPPVEEEWVLEVLSVSSGAARVGVSVLGPPLAAPSPSPREPGFEVFLPTKEDAFSGVELLRLFHRPELTTRGMRAVLDRGPASVEGSHTVRPVVVEGKTREGRELTIAIEDERVRAIYRVLLVDDLPALGILSADLDERWTTVTADGDLRNERRHEHLELSDLHR